MVNQIASGTGSQEQGKKSSHEGLQKLGQEARSQAPSFSVDLSKQMTPEEYSDLRKRYDEVYGREEMLYRKYYLICEGYKLPEVSGFKMARKV